MLAIHSCFMRTWVWAGVQVKDAKEEDRKWGESICWVIGSPGQVFARCVSVNETDVVLLWSCREGRQYKNFFSVICTMKKNPVCKYLMFLIGFLICKMELSAIPVSRFLWGWRWRECVRHTELLDVHCLLLLEGKCGNDCSGLAASWHLEHCSHRLWFVEKVLRWVVHSQRF